MDNKYDVINPKHYDKILFIPKEDLKKYLDENGNLSLQYMDLMEYLLTNEEYQGHLKGQIWKYLLRAGKKDNKAQEAGKAKWYLERLQTWWGSK
jgi:hypothetical protein